MQTVVESRSRSQPGNIELKQHKIQLTWICFSSIWRMMMAAYEEQRRKCFFNVVALKKTLAALLFIPDLDTSELIYGGLIHLLIF